MKMLSYFSCAHKDKNTLKPFKVRDVSGSRRIGIAAGSLSDLQKKTAEKFKLKRNQITIVLEEDGTEVDDDEYLRTLNPNTLLVVLNSKESWEGVSSHLDNVLRQILSLSKLPQVKEEIDKLIQSENSPAYLDILSKIAPNLDMSLEAESRHEDPEWFQDVPSRFKTKSCFMRDKARQRVRGYLYHTKDFIKNQNLKSMTRTSLEEITDYFIVRLKKENYFSDYFARTSLHSKLRMCDVDGWFQCEGAFSEDKCQFAHCINPYGNVQYRRLLSTWDLDHGVEKSRTVLPCLKEAASHPSKVVNRDYFFDLLFTRQNLKLVNPICHDKSGHSSKHCEPHLIYLG